MKGKLLDVGCGKMPYKDYILKHSQVSQYIGLDIDTHRNYGTQPDVIWNGEVIPFDNQFFDTVLLTEVLEHSFEPEKLLNEVNRVLDCKGYLLATVPFLWNLHEAPYDHYRYTPFALEKLFKNAGFCHIEIIANGAWDASLAQMLGLWVRRRKMKPIYKRVLSWVLKPIIAKLLKLDKRSKVSKTNFVEGFMPSGFSIVCQKP